ILLLVGSGGTGLAALGIIHTIERERIEKVEGLPRTKVQRADVQLAVTASGLIDSSEKTLIECELESLTISSEGRSFLAKGASTIIELVPEGTLVNKGDLLCRFDASEFEEMTRQQEIQVQRAKSDLQKSRYDLQTAEIAKNEFCEGLLPQDRLDIDAQLTLAQSEFERQKDRLAWTGRMVQSGYTSQAQLKREQQSLLRDEIMLERTKREREILENFQAKTARIRLEGVVDHMRSELAFQELRLRRREEQLAKFRQQVERCTIRAPHGGIVVYANEQD